MRLLEHQGKKLLANFGLRFTEPVVVDSPTAAAEVATRLGVPVVLKAQVPFGGRGKAGAVKFADNPEQAQRVASELLGMKLRGEPVALVSIEPRLVFTREFYVGIAWETTAKLPVALLSTAGGIEVERPGDAQLVRQTFDPWIGLRAFEGHEMARRLGLSGKTLVELGGLLQRLANAFLTCDAMLAEINPLVEAPDGALIGLDARVGIEDDALTASESASQR